MYRIRVTWLPTLCLLRQGTKHAPKPHVGKREDTHSTSLSSQTYCSASRHQPLHTPFPPSPLPPPLPPSPPPPTPFPLPLPPSLLPSAPPRANLVHSNTRSVADIGNDRALLPLELAEGWQRINIDLERMVRLAFGTSYLTASQVTVRASARVAKVFFQSEAFSDYELPSYLRVVAE